MAWDPNPMVLLSGFAAIAQVFVAGALLLSNPRNERVSVLGVLFFLNGSVAGFHAILIGFSDPFGGSRVTEALLRSSTFFGLSTNILLLWLALLYPYRARFLPRRGLWWIAPLSSLAVLFALNLVLPDGVAGARNRGSVNLAEAIGGYVLFEAAFPVLLVRWALIWRSEMPAVLRHQFLLMMGAFALRGMHVVPLFAWLYPEYIARGALEPTPGATAVFVAIVVAMVGSVAATLILVGTHRPSDSRRRRQNHLVLGILLVGLAIGLGSIVARLVLVRGDDWYGFWAQADVLVLRPVLVWFALARFGFASRGLRSYGFAWTFLGSMAGGFVAIGALRGLGPWLPAGPRTAASIAIGGVVAVGLVWFIRRWVGPRASAPDSTTTRLTDYAAMVAEATRNGRSSRTDSLRLARSRERLGITLRQHDAIVRGLTQAQKPFRDWQAGDVVLERYSLEAPMGGGQAIAWKAKDILADDVVVLKVPRLPMDAAALHREIDALASLDHPHIVSVRRVEWHDGQAVLVVPFIPAGTLEDAMASKRPSKGDVAKLLSQVGAALHHMHARSMVHGDVKPSNIFGDEERGFLLADFGMSAALGTAESLVRSTRFTPPAVLAGGAWNDEADQAALVLVAAEALGCHPVSASLPAPMALEQMKRITMADVEAAVDDALGIASLEPRS